MDFCFIKNKIREKEKNMLVSEMNGIRPVDAGRQDCHDLHSWGPGVRQCYIIHYIISGKGTFTCGKKTYTYRRTELFNLSRAGGAVRAG